VLRALLGAALVSWVVAAAGWAATPAWGGGPLAVAATSTDLRSLVEAVGGDRVRVEALAPPLQDPHAVEVKPGQIAALRGAALLVRIGLDHEPWLAGLLRTVGGSRFAPGGPSDLDCSKGIELLQADTARVRPERGEHIHGFGNTHYWLDPENARPITAGILDALARLAPSDRAYFESRRADFLKRLDAGLARWIGALQPYRGAMVVVVHESWPYFARRFGLRIVAAVEPTPGVPPSPAYLARITRQMKDANVRVVIAEPYSSATLVARVASLSGARPVTLVTSVGGAPEVPDYLALFDLDVARLAEALRTR
jgi:ABC-type Zn uptake system ZnuABC Zn-binding protein ZnuA